MGAVTSSILIGGTSHKALKEMFSDSVELDKPLVIVASTAFGMIIGSYVASRITTGKIGSKGNALTLADSQITHFFVSFTFAVIFGYCFHKYMTSN